MSSQNAIQNIKKQSGIALLILVVAVTLSAMTYFITQISSESAELEGVMQTQKTLKIAKHALIAHALIHDQTLNSSGESEAGEIGYLPCPDLIDNAVEEGEQDGVCGHSNIHTAQINAIGYLPWKTLGLPILKDGDGNCLWYAVSSTYKLNPQDSTKMLNEDTYGMFEVVDDSGMVTIGSSAENRPVAIVFAPGKKLGSQDRNFEEGSECGKDYDNVAAYLEGNGTTNNAVLSTTNNAIDQFILATSSSEDAETNPYNDKFITISRNEIWDAIFRSQSFQNKMTDLTEALAKCVASYSKGYRQWVWTPGVGWTASKINNWGRRLPWPARITLAGDYNVDASYTDEGDTGTYGYAGRFPYEINDSNDDSALALSDILFNAPEGCAWTGTITGDTINLADADNEYRKLWSKWKDHFFYAVSRKYRPRDNEAEDCGDCLSVDGTKYAGVVLFANDRIDGADRSDKTVLSSYLEGGNATDIPDMDGQGLFTSTTSAGGNANDIMFCIEDKDKDPQFVPPALTVVSCD